MNSLKVMLVAIWLQNGKDWDNTYKAIINKKAPDQTYIDEAKRYISLYGEENIIAPTDDKYQEFVDAGIPAEDARAVLPNACATSMIVSTNLRELIHVANLRLCSRAQTEIRLLIKAMCDELIAKEAWLKDYLVPKCETNGFCDEDKSCGRKSRLNLKEETE